MCVLASVCRRESGDLLSVCHRKCVSSKEWRSLEYVSSRVCVVKRVVVSLVCVIASVCRQKSGDLLNVCHRHLLHTQESSPTHT